MLNRRLGIVALNFLMVPQGFAAVRDNDSTRRAANVQSSHPDSSEGIGGAKVDPKVRESFKAALTGKTIYEQTAMVNAVSAVKPSDLARMMVNVPRAMSLPEVRGGIMALPEEKRAVAMLALGGNNADRRSSFAAALAPGELPANGAVMAQPAGSRAAVAATLALNLSGVRGGLAKFNSLPQAQQTRVLELTKSMPTSNPAMIGRAISLLRNPSFVQSLDRVAGSLQNQTLAVATRVTNPTGVVTRLGTLDGNPGKPRPENALHVGQQQLFDNQLAGILMKTGVPRK